MYSQLNTYTSVATQNQVYSGNSCFDPDVTGTGTQPYNYDDWTVQYNRYVVLGSTIEVSMALNGSTAANNIIVSLCPRHTSTTPALLDAMSAPYAKYTFLAGNQNGHPIVLKHSISSKEMLGMTDSELIASNNALYNANPSNPWYWHITIDEADGSSTIAAKSLVRITYDVVFFDRNETTLDFLSSRVQEALALRKLRQSKSGERRESKSLVSLELDPPQPDAGWNMVRKSLNEQGLVGGSPPPSALVPRPARPESQPANPLSRGLTTPSSKGK